MNIDFRKFLKEHQYEIPHKLMYLAYYYPNVTWKDALEAYCFSVELILRKFNVETICDSPLDWGKGHLMAEEYFEKELRRLNEKSRSNENID